MRLYRSIPEFKKPNGDQNYSVVAEHTDTKTTAIILSHVEEALAIEVVRALSFFERDITDAIKSLQHDLNEGSVR